VVPALGLQAPVVPIEMDAAGVLTPPADVDTVGWWQRSAQPGSGQGQTLITGHTVRVGDGAMDRIGELGSGARVEVRAASGTAAYRVSDVVTYDRAEVADRAQELFGQDRDDGRLVLVTCTDWNGEVWERNIIVLAQPV
jgi:LPXTG-site transpeptidase (sortase) family protein